ncbi:hypothetical protein KQH82_05890 [bacterium]|nr:hypothetical protein [bacterium]
MEVESLKYFKYEIAVGAAVPMPKPKSDAYPNNQNSVQEYLLTLCKEHIGSLGKIEKEWVFNEAVVGEKVRLDNRSDIRRIFDFAEELGMIVAAPDQSGDGWPEGFMAYKLSETYWTKFDKFAP